MSGRFIHTIGDYSNLKDSFNGLFLKGHQEPRIAFVGRSNVGKSSLLNALLGQKLAQVSKEPGKTRSIHFYLWNEGGRIFADLPGYGYATASQQERERWAKFIKGYFEEDQGLERVLLLIDGRHGPLKSDWDAIYFLADLGCPFTWVMTKRDGIKNQSEQSKRVREVKTAIAQLKSEYPHAKVFPENQALWISTEKKEGLKELANLIMKGLV